MAERVPRNYSKRSERLRMRMRKDESRRRFRWICNIRQLFQSFIQLIFSSASLKLFNEVSFVHICDNKGNELILNYCLTLFLILEVSHAEYRLIF